MNIRKFIGATSRDALRLVREALGADAVVLSNRTNDDGSVEIVALADTDFAQIAPDAGDAASHGAMPGLPAPGANPYASLTAAQPAASYSAPASGAMASNPYANGMPDVFSAVFGASPEVGAAATDEGRASLPDGASIAAPRLAERERASFATRSTAPASAPNAPSAPNLSAAEAADASLTMAETNPWLIDHARRIAAQSERAAHSSRAHTMTPAAAAAKGLGTPGRVLAEEEHEKTQLPDWAHEAARVAARRAVPRVKPAFEGAGEQEAHAMADAVRARIEEIVNQTVMSELSAMRGMMEEQFAGLAWGERQRRSPVNGEVTKALFSAGFSAQLVRMVVENMPEVEHVDAGMDWVNQVLASNLPVLENEDALMERGGVFALMGPTGVGKTTTTAKLAARCVMRFGASKVALLTTDSYRIGGHEQLRIFGKILGVSVHAVKDAADLQLALAELRNKHIVLIDTIGMSQRDRTVSDQIAMLCGAGQPVQRLLLLNATSHGDTLNEVVQAYRSAPGQPELAGCILTKLDEATNLGGVLDTVIRYKLPVHYVSTGQKVPENLYVATKKFLIKSAFCIPRDGSPFVPHDDEIPALLSALSSRSSAELHEVRFG
ncbi:flagellar biosynthesis protein FlhF [Trinickia dabaoshanensis]|uniref:Flagellar biosynthesis protein FlhF n=1 Tax=Trinickia dabaoshanensis TaxID=564714 RepID=A0A2N7VZE3_9BURK|nr:flagellar biosynthesis protein FlhF [Trinickia dabaoshanensis]PMS22500.1 flagellar biosynthesis protein FlhF [Trinickia dabaoshanensis]